MKHRYIVECYERGNVEVVQIGTERTKAKAIEKANNWLSHEWSVVKVWVWDCTLHRTVFEACKGGFHHLMARAAIAEAERLSR